MREQKARQGQEKSNPGLALSHLFFSSFGRPALNFVCGRQSEENEETKTYARQLLLAHILSFLSFYVRASDSMSGHIRLCVRSTVEPANTEKEKRTKTLAGDRAYAPISSSFYLTGHNVIAFMWSGQKKERDGLSLVTRKRSHGPVSSLSFVLWWEWPVANATRLHRLRGNDF